LGLLPNIGTSFELPLKSEGLDWFGLNTAQSDASPGKVLPKSDPRDWLTELTLNNEVDASPGVELPESDPCDWLTALAPKNESDDSPGLVLPKSEPCEAPIGTLQNTPAP
jgi:hypothetical protein